MAHHDRESEVRFMRSPNDWPMWPVLPLKRVGGPWDVGIMGEDRPRVYITNLYRGITPGTKYIDYDDHYAMYDDGWRVD